MKTCFKCGIEKPITEFYKHSGMSSGYLGKCKECTKGDVRNNYKKNIAHYKQYEKGRAILPHRIEARQKYAQTDIGREKSNEARRRWILDLKNSVKRASHILVGNAVRDGRLVKPCRCSNCGKQTTRIEGHHDDYAKPLEVRWLCRKCHFDWHKENKPLNF